ncbi:MAG: hypothetical protein FWC90_07555 [Oscillospiraceae bacterium]|nr:hypothetical protein [Oscillospiraceae bacterium]
MSKEDTQPQRRQRCNTKARLTVARYAAVLLIAVIAIIVISYFSSARSQANYSVAPPSGSRESCICAPFEEGEIT